MTNRDPESMLGAGVYLYAAPAEPERSVAPWTMPNPVVPAPVVPVPWLPPDRYRILTEIAEKLDASGYTEAARYVREVRDGR